ncbi:Rdx family-domain-containing protein [Protomyces lactucae-debilis]|uniref:Rdx family-domain-containing protein n=1 Tax=Protomyces lactucae-debilis TaxID=2754530 RepID=A0A1Y2FLQ3_PROLT|nr:Rdx family-domain-containing protein [Protomyces lactucae-debilis]ORY84922.1 Rdx family-domain-containing protein [Protomyces lactucae-debilis]
MTKPRVAIEYCTQCRWMLRAAWFAQELLTTFQDVIGEVALIPASGGHFVVTITHEGKESCIWNRKDEGGFPEAKQLKQLVRNIINPEQDLGHSDKPVKGRATADGSGDVIKTGGEQTKEVCTDC